MRAILYGALILPALGLELTKMAGRGVLARWRRWREWAQERPDPETLKNPPFAEGVPGSVLGGALVAMLLFACAYNVVVALPLLMVLVLAAMKTRK